MIKKISNYTLFLPNGIGDLLMCIPAISRLLRVVDSKNVIIVVYGILHFNLLKAIFREEITILVRFDGGFLSQFKLWIRLFLIKNNLIFAPLLSTKKRNLFFFVSLRARIIIPDNYLFVKFMNLENSGKRLGKASGHQVDYYINFLKDHINRFDDSPVEPKELILSHRFKSFEDNLIKSSGRQKIVIGLSSGLHERHKIPSPEIFAKIINQVCSLIPVDIAVIGIKSDLPLINSFRQFLSVGTTCDVMLDIPLHQLIGKLSNFNVGLSGTTGQGHVMAAAGIPLLILAGVTNPLESGPFSTRLSILTHEFECGPCYQENFRGGCGLIKCMDTLDIQKASTAIINLLHDDKYGTDWRSKCLSKQTVFAYDAILISSSIKRSKDSRLAINNYD
jgi:ADP-heptose:LPS heptosyltransferase